MDQVRKVLTWLKRYHFWVLCVLIALISLYCWWSASGAMSKQFTENKGKISGGLQQVTSVLSDPFHPNAGVSERQQKEIGLLSAEATKLWQQLYDRQRENVLTWPSGPTELKPQFVQTVEKLQFGDEIEDSLREHYQNYIFNHFPKLPEKVGAKAIEEGVAGPGGGGGFTRMRGPEGPGGGAMSTGVEGEDDGDYICYWAPEDQALVRAELEFPQTPSSLRIWCTQENLWVYHALLNVIKNTNNAANATRMSNAAVRGIYSLQVGQAAAPFSRQPGRILKLQTAAPAGDPTMGEAPSASPEGDPSAVGGGMEFSRSGLAEGSTGEMSEAQERGLLLHGRYLGDDGKPIPFGGGGGSPEDPTAAADASVPAGPLDLTVFGKEYLRLPVRMVLEMDQRHLPRLIAECATQPLQIEVQEVRVNAGDLMAGGGATSGQMSFSEGGGVGGGSVLPDLTGLQQFNPHPEIVTVAIQGVIYIFKKPNAEILKPPGEEDASVAVAQ